MALDIKTTIIKPKRHTYSHIAERLGSDRPASRYEEASFDVEPTSNFHYRPVWDPRFEIYDTARTKIQMEDWYVLTDPRQFYYGTYTINRNKMFEAAETQLNFVETRGLLANLTEADRTLVQKIILPLRHYEWGANMNNVQITRFGSGTIVTQATAFNAMDRLGLAQLICRIGLAFDAALADTDSSCLHATRAQWTDDELWQPLRKALEDSFVVEDWFELFVAQNFIMDNFVYQFVYTQFDDMLIEKGITSISLMTEIFRKYRADSSRWVNAVLKRAISENEENKKQIAEWVADWSKQVTPAVKALALYIQPEQADKAVQICEEAVQKHITAIGL
ncbi:MAG: phenol hydroxylase [Alphaproteobacteria bacterium]|nr:phenol hydroxylase [Alphaproteobacteria bacterium]